MILTIEDIYVSAFNWHFIWVLKEIYPDDPTWWIHFRLPRDPRYTIRENENLRLELLRDHTKPEGWNLIIEVKNLAIMPYLKDLKEWMEYIDWTTSEQIGWFERWRIIWWEIFWRVKQWLVKV